jgi:hypothetical protein
MNASLVREKITKINTVLAGNPCPTHGFTGGTLGLLYYYFHAGKVLGDGELTATADGLLEGIFNDLNHADGGLRGSFLSDGGAGLGWVVNYLQGHGYIDFDIDHEFSELDDFLFESALSQLRHDNTDFLHGAMGIFHYFAHRKQTPAINRYLNELAGPILAKAVDTGHGIWIRNYGLQPAKINEVNFSLSHGLSGYLLALMEGWTALRDREPVEQLIRRGIQFLMKHECPVDFEGQEYSFFPFRFEADSKEMHRVNRLAWCYGDLNEVLLLYRAGRLLGDGRYIHIANRIGGQTAMRRSYEATLSVDGHFCHGSSGLAAFYKSLYQEAGLPVYADAYRYWLELTLSQVDKEIEVGHYAENRAGLLEGWAGIGLVLADGLLEEETDWARAFLL